MNILFAESNLEEGKYSIYNQTTNTVFRNIFDILLVLIILTLITY